MYPGQIFKATHPLILQLYETMASTNCMYGGVASPFQLTPTDEEDQENLKEMLQGLNNANKLLNQICPGCSGNHSVWWLCGGAASYWAEKTTTYTDYDWYVHCDGMFNTINNFEGHDVDYHTMWTGRTSVVNMVNNFYKVF